jgi:hypothetical protein
VATGVPTDPAFYAALIPMAQRLGTKPEDLLWVWASETGFDPTLAGDSRTISTLMHGVVAGGLLTQSEWDSLPTLTATQQLPFIERFYKLLTSKYIGRGFQDTFEAYLANAAPGLLRHDGQYNPATTMYGDPDAPAHTIAWDANWPMDSYPAASKAAAARGISGAAFNKAFGQQLVSEGLLRGWITLGDLKNFMLRPGVSSFANDAVRQLRATQAGTSAYQQTASSSNDDGSDSSPTFDKSFGNPNAVIDTRVAPSQPVARTTLSVPELVVLAGVAYFALRWFQR